MNNEQWAISDANSGEIGQTGNCNEKNAGNILNRYIIYKLRLKPV